MRSIMVILILCCILLLGCQTKEKVIMDGGEQPGWMETSEQCNIQINSVEDAHSCLAHIIPRLIKEKIANG